VKKRRTTHGGFWLSIKNLGWSLSSSPLATITAFRTFESGAARSSDGVNGAVISWTEWWHETLSRTRQSPWATHDSDYVVVTTFRCRRHQPPASSGEQTFSWSQLFWTIASVSATCVSCLFLFSFYMRINWLIGWLIIRQSEKTQ